MTKSLITVRTGDTVTYVHDRALAERWSAHIMSRTAGSESYQNPGKKSPCGSRQSCPVGFSSETRRQVSVWLSRPSDKTIRGGHATVRPDGQALCLDSGIQSGGDKTFGGGDAASNTLEDGTMQAPVDSTIGGRDDAVNAFHTDAGVNTMGG